MSSLADTSGIDNQQEEAFKARIDELQALVDTLRSEVRASEEMNQVRILFLINQH